LKNALDELNKNIKYLVKLCNQESLRKDEYIKELKRFKI